MSKSRDQLISYLREIDITDKVVLDVGVQNNPASKYVRGKAKEYLTLDIDEKWNPDFVSDINSSNINLSILKNIENNHRIVGGADIVFCLEVLEHCWDPVQSVKSLFDFTKEGGVCYISAPFINPIHDEVDYLRYTPEWFYKVLSEVGFKEIIIKERVATVGKESLLWFYKEEGLRMSKIRLQRGDGYLFPLIGTFVEARK